MDPELEDARANDAGLDLSDPHLRRTMKLAEQLIGMPRHLSQHVGGFILTERPLTETVPIGNGAMDDRTFIEWDKDDIDELGILKIDVLALGMLTCIRKCFDLIEQHHGERWELATVPQEVPQVYDMLCKGDSLGVFQVESRAQMNMLPRLKPRCFYDLVIEVAIVRPGPIQGDMVHPYLKRRSGKEPVTFPCPRPEHGPPDELEKILGRTLGVPIFQEQAMKIALDAAQVQLGGSEPAAQGDGDLPLQGEHRAARRRKWSGGWSRAATTPTSRSAASTRSRASANMASPKATRRASRTSSTCRAGSNGNIRRRSPAALLNSQPMGFYAPGADRPRRARAWRRGARGGCEPQRLGLHAWNASDRRALRSGSACAQIERASQLARRLGLRQIDGLRSGRRAARTGPTTVEELRSRGGVPVHAIQRLAAADAFRSMGLDRRAALWDSRALKQAPDLPLFAHAEARDEGVGSRAGAAPGDAAQRACRERLSDHPPSR